VIFRTVVYFFAGDTNLLGVVPSIGDIIYAIILIAFLLNKKKL
jgi:hypothetical protein